jgi:carbonic anhydrase/acetyltransferase-like protein (isoleucine patch superfamily)
MWSGNHVGHDSVIEDHCFISSHAVIAGNVTIGAYCFIGVNATFRDKIKVAPDCIIGAGALILRDTKTGEVYAGQRTKPRAFTSSQIEL